MAEKLMLTHCKEQGFVLVTALILLSLLTLMSLAMFYTSRSSIQTSATAQSTTEAYYYAETAVHYVSWALANDAEFDNFTYTGTYQAAPFGEPNVPSNAATVGDFTELRTYLWDPGPTGQARTWKNGTWQNGASPVDTNGSVYTAGQVMYFDNSPICSSPNPADCKPNPPSTPSPQLKKRFLCMQDASKFSNCIDVSVAPATRVSPPMANISVNLPRYIKLEISSSGVVTPSIPSLPHRNPPVAGEDIPVNGAIVWLTAVDPTSLDKDIELFPMDPAGAYGGTLPENCATLGACPCKAPATLDPAQPYQPDPADPQYPFFVAAQACNANPLQSDDPASPNYLPTTDPNYVSPWLSMYGVAAYAIGYVNGKPSKLLRAVIM